MYTSPYVGNSFQEATYVEKRFKLNLLISESIYL